jgi:hypothetical protein
VRKQRQDEQKRGNAARALCSDDDERIQKDSQSKSPMKTKAKGEEEAGQ